MTRCEFCPAPATHRARVAGCGDETINVCCEHNEACIPDDDDCITIDDLRAISASNVVAPPHRYQKCDSCSHPNWMHENGGCEYAPGGRSCDCTGFVDLDLPFGFHPAVKFEGVAR